MQLNLCTFKTEIQSTQNHDWNKNLLSKSFLLFSLILLGCHIILKRCNKYEECLT